MWKNKRLRCVVIFAFGMLILGGIGFWWIGLGYGTPDVCCVIVRGVSHSKGSERLLSEGIEFRVDDPDIVAELTSFFPGVGTQRFSYWESYCAYDIEIEFVFRDGRRVRAFTKDDFCRWGRGTLGTRRRIDVYAQSLLRSW